MHQALFTCICAVPLVILALFMFVYLFAMLLSNGFTTAAQPTQIALYFVLIYLSAAFVRLGGLNLPGTGRLSVWSVAMTGSDLWRGCTCQAPRSPLDTRFPK